MRRMVDLVAATVLLTLALPVIVPAALGCAVALRAWPFFVQQRIGRDGRPFRFVKLRTLPTTVPRYQDKLSLTMDDVPRFCRVLRLAHIDELPQLALVITGRMSLVGPRPEMPALHARLEPTFARVRTSVRPGCTGLWQVSRDCVRLIGERPQYDVFYVANRGVRLDLWILGRTLAKMLRRRTVTLADVPGWAQRAGSPQVEEFPTLETAA